MKDLAIVILLLAVAGGIRSKVTSQDYRNYMRNLTHVTEQQLRIARRGNSTLIVFFNADISGETRRAMKGFHTAAKRLEKMEIGIPVTFMDCVAHRKHCENLGVYSYPKVFIFTKARMVEINLQGRTQKLMTENIFNAYKKPGIYLEKRTELEEIKKTEDRFFFWCGFADEDFEMFKQTAPAYPWIKWYYSHDRSEMASANGIYFNDMREGTSDMINGPHGPLWSGRMDMFTQKYLYLLRSLSDYSMDRIFQHHQGALALFYPDTNEERGVTIPFWHAAMEIKRELLTIQIPMLEHGAKNERNLLELRKYLGVENPYSPAIRIVVKDKENPLRWKMYQLRQKITVDHVKQFYKDFKNGKLNEFHRSERPERGHALVTKLVGKNYKKSVTNDKFDVISVIHSDENETLSTRVLKVITIVAKVLGKLEYIKFVKINGELNSDELIPQRGYPYIRLYKKGSKGEHVEYNGMYSAKELSQWVCDSLGIQNPFDEVVAAMKNRRKGNADEKYEEKQDI